LRGGAPAVTHFEEDNPAVSASPFTVEGAAPPPTMTRFEETDAAVSYSPAGAWVTRGPEIADFSGGTAVSSEVAGETATFTFTGTAVSWIGLKCSVCGIASVSIDGGDAITVDTGGPGAIGSGLTSEVVFSTSGLTAGVSHTMVITVMGNTSSEGANIAVDAFDVTGAGGPPPTTRIEETDTSAISYLGNWSPVEDERVSGGSYVEASQMGVRWISGRGTATGIANIYLDCIPGEPECIPVFEADTFANPEQARVVEFTALDLPRGPHTLTIEVTGRKNPASEFTFIVVDAFDVTP
jgi:hypothetical protein